MTVLSRVLANPSLRRVEFAFLGFGAAEYGVWVAVLVYAYQRGGTTLTAAIAVVQLIPAAIVAPLAAQMIARRGPASVLRIGYAVQALAVGATATLILLDAVPAATYTAAVIAASAVTLTRPAQATLFPSLARTPSELTAVNVVSGWVESVTMLIGPALAGLLIRIDGPGAACALFAVALGGSSVLVASLGNPAETTGADAEPEDTDEQPIPLSAVRTQPGVMALLGLVAIQFVAIGALDVLVVVLALRVLSLGSSGAGYLQAAFGAGAVLGGVGGLLLVGRHRLVLPLLGAAIGWGAAFTVLGVWPTAVGGFVFLAAAGAGRTIFDVCGRTIMQRVVAPHVLGRVFGILEGLAMLGLAIGSISVPVLMAVAGPKAALIGIGGLLIIAGLGAQARLRGIERATVVPERELALLRDVPMFEVLTAPVLEGLAQALHRQPVAVDEVVVREGETGDRFYLVADGTLEVTIGDTLIRTLSAGDSFGEIALLRDGIRTATVTARDPATLYVLGRAPFLEAVTGSRQATRAAEQIVVGRLGSAGS